MSHVIIVRHIFKDPAASRKRLELAARILLDTCKSESKVVGESEVTIAEMLHCLDFGGIIAECGARCLYIRTGRDGLGWSPAESNGLPFIVERTDWETYLHDHYSKTAA